MGEELKFEHEKSNQVDGAIKAGAKFQEDAPLPLLMWFPVVVLGLTAIDYFMLFFNDGFAERFFAGDSTVPLLGGVVFGLLYLLVTLGLFWRRRWSIWTLLLLLVVEMLFSYYLVAGGNTDVFLNIRVPLMEANADGLITMVPGLALTGGEFIFIRDAFLLVITFACYPWTE